MKTTILSIMLAILASVYAEPAEATFFNWQNSECLDLRAPGVTRGLFAICVAYCDLRRCDEYPEGEEPWRCRLLLDVYEYRADENDPEMPCLVEDTAPVCPCWTPESERVADGGLGLTPDSCLFDGPNEPQLFDIAIYDDGSDMVSFVADVGQCEYMNTLSGEDEIIPTTEEEEAACRNGVHDLMDRDFGGTENCDQLP